MDIPTQAFTTTASQRVLELKNEVQVAKAFNPDNDPFPTRLHTYTAVWDTGATHSMISTKVVEGVGLSPSGKATVTGIGFNAEGHSYLTNTYFVSFILPNNVGLVSVKVSEGGITGGDILIGMDIIGTGDFAISQKEGKTVWSFQFPPGNVIDFVPEAETRNRKLYKQSPAGQDMRRKERNKTKQIKRKARK